MKRKAQKEESSGLQKYWAQQHLGIGNPDNPCGNQQEDLLGRMRQALEKAIKGEPQLVVVQPHYPELPPEELPNAKERPTQCSGRGVGKTTLLRAFAERARGRLRCGVHAFLDNQKGLTEGQQFYRYHFVPKLPPLARQSKRLKWRSRLESAVLRSWILLRAFASSTELIFALIGAAGIIAALTLVRPEAIVQNWLRSFFAALGPGRWVAYPVALAVLVVLFLLQFGTDPDLKKEWRDDSFEELQKKHGDALNSKLNGLAADPAGVLECLPRSKGCVIVIDDADLLDNYSLEQLLELYKLWTERRRNALCMVLAWNPYNPDLDRLPERSEIASRLLGGLGAADTGKPKRLYANLQPMQRPQLLQILVDYYPRVPADRLEAAASSLARRYMEAGRCVEDLLGFFGSIDCEGLLANGFDEENLAKAFTDHTRREVEQAETLIREKTTGLGEDLRNRAVSFLQYMLAYPKPHMPSEHLRSLLRYAQRGQFTACARKLTGSGLVVEENGQYAFRDARTRYLLAKRWTQWEAVAQKRATAVFALLCGKEWCPQLALKSEPSRESVEMLYAEGLHWLVDCDPPQPGIALSYLGHDGAVGQWLALVDSAARKPEEMLYWREPLAPRSMGRSFGPEVPKGKDAFHIGELACRAAMAYWHIGQSDKAIELLERVAKHLVPCPGTWPAEQKEMYIKRYLDALAAVEVLRAAFAYYRGKRDDWANAERRCQDLLAGGLSLTPSRRGLAVLLATSISHYRHFAIGHLLPPLRFRPEPTDLSRLEQLGEDLALGTSLRLRALCMALDTLCESVLPVSFFAPDVVHYGAWWCASDNGDLEQLTRLAEKAEKVLREARETDPAVAKGLVDVASISDPLLPQGREHAAVLDLCEGMLLTYQCTGQLVGIGMALSPDRAAIRAQSQRNLVTTGCTQSGEGYPGQLNSKIQQADACFRKAWETYVAIGHRPGQAEVLYHRALAELLTGSRSGEGQPWYELLARRCRVSNDLGFQLEALRADMILAQGYRDTDSTKALKHYANTRDRLEQIAVPEVIFGELAYRQAYQRIGQADHNSSDISDTVKLLDSALRNYIAHQELSLAEQDAKYRYMTASWHIVELHKREAANEKSSEMQRREARDKAGKLILEAGRQGFRAHEARAAVAKAQLDLLLDEPSYAAGPLRRAIAHFRKVDEQFWLVLALLTLIQVVQMAPDVRSSVSLTEAAGWVGTLVSFAFANRGSTRVLVQTLIALIYLFVNWVCEHFHLPSQLHGLFLEPMLRAIEEACAGQIELVRGSPGQTLFDLSLSTGKSDWLALRSLPLRCFAVSIAVTAQTRAKSECLREHLNLKDWGDERGAKEALTRGVALINPDNPEELDFRLLNGLTELWQSAAATSRRSRSGPGWAIIKGTRYDARDIAKLEKELRETTQSRHYLYLAQELAQQGFAPRWALERATAVERKSPYYGEAKHWLESLARAAQAG